MHFNEAFDPFRALRSTWRILKTAPGAVLVGGLLLWICDEGALWVEARFEFPHDVQFDFTTPESAREGLSTILDHWAPLVAGGFGLFIAALAIAAFLFGSLVHVGYAAAVERALTQHEDDLGDLFEARGRWGSMVLVRLLGLLVKALIALPGLALAAFAAVAAIASTEQSGFALLAAGLVLFAYLPVAVYLWLGFALAPLAVAVEGLGPTEALGRSWQLVRGHRWTLFLYLLVLRLAGLLLLCCCCVLFFGGTILEQTSLVDSYLRLIKSGEPETWLKKPESEPSTAA